jgi:hypothetical protein
MSCSIDGCLKPPPYVRGFCGMHYSRWKRGADLHKREERRGLCLSERLWQYIDVGDFDECWEWTGFREPVGGYGRFVLYAPDVPSQRNIPAHRLAYEQFWRIPLQHWALHRCNNPPCCNPLHVYDDTNSQNQLDSIAAGTAVVLRRDWRNTARGERAGRAKLTEEIVREIRRRYAEGGITQDQLAAEYGVGQPRISALLLRKTWAHVE